MLEALRSQQKGEMVKVHALRQRVLSTVWAEALHENMGFLRQWDTGRFLRTEGLGT